VIEHVKEGVILLCKVDGGGYESCLPYSFCHVLFGFIYFFFCSFHYYVSFQFPFDLGDGMYTQICVSFILG
jgi:hypothetical protein